MGVLRVQGQGVYGQSDNHHEVWLPTNRSLRGAPLIVIVHGTAAGGWSYSDTPEARKKLDYLCARGFVVASADGDFDSDPNIQAVRGTWGTDESMTGITDLVTGLGARYGLNTTQIGLWGDSAGGASVLGYLWRNPTKVAGVICHQGAVDIQAVRNLGNSLINFLCDQAYHGNWAAAAATHDPAQNVPLLIPYANRIRLYYTTGDGLVPTQPTINFADAVGCERVCMGAGDHGTGDIFSFADQAAWFADRLGI